MGAEETSVPPQPTLSDGVVTLRPLARGDVGLLDELHADPDVQRWNWRGPARFAAADVVAGAPRAWDAGAGASYAITVDGVFVGMLHAILRRYPVMREAELGYMLLPGARGRGYATRAVRVVSEWLLRDFDLVRVQARTNPENPASERVLERAGFVREGVARAGAVYPATREIYDTTMWSLVRSDIA